MGESQEMEMVRQSATANAALKQRLREGYMERKKMLEDGIAREKKKMQRDLDEKHAAAFAEIDLKSEGTEQSILRRRNDTEVKILAIKKEVTDSVEVKESDWRNKSLVWLEKSRRKFVSKAKADAEAAAAKRRHRK